MVQHYLAKPPPHWSVRVVGVIGFLAFGYVGYLWDELNREELNTFKNKTLLYGYGFRKPEEKKTSELLD
ncbi:hypothetical protein HDE_09424 [Halotydeus destructor]|nr:hypothetical protein HDE_09424 [Halotydeus destructor]